jgi:hypothetical protein
MINLLVLVRKRRKLSKKSLNYFLNFLFDANFHKSFKFFFKVVFRNAKVDYKTAKSGLQINDDKLLTRRSLVTHLTFSSDPL